MKELYNIRNFFVQYIRKKIKLISIFFKKTLSYEIKKSRRNKRPYFFIINETVRFRETRQNCDDHSDKGVEDSKASTVKCIMFEGNSKRYDFIFCVSNGTSLLQPKSENLNFGTNSK